MPDEAVKTLAVKLALEDSTFQAGMKELKSELSVADSAFKASGAGIKNWGSTLDGMKAHAQELSSKISATSEMISKYNTQIAKSQEALEKHVASMQKDKQAVDSAQAAYDKNVAELGKDSEATQKSKQALDDATAAYKRDEQQVVANQKSINGYTTQVNNATASLKVMQKELAENTGFSAVGKQLDTTGKKLATVGSQMSSVGQSLTMGITMPIAAAAAGFFELSEKFEEATNKIRRGTGATGKQLEELDGMFKQIYSDVPTTMDNVAEAVTDLSKRTNLTGQALQDLSEQELRLSKISGIDLSTTIQDTTRMLNDAQIAPKDYATALNYIYTVSEHTGVGIDKLSEEMAKYGAPLREMGFNWQQAAAMLGQFEQSGVNAQLVMGSMRIALGKFAQAGKEPVTALAQTIEKIKEAGSTGKANALALQVFGARAGPDMAAAIREGHLDLQGLLDTLKNSPDSIDTAAKSTETLKDKFTELKNRLEVKLEPIGENLAGDLEKAMPAIEGIADDIAELADKFADLTPEQQEATLKLIGMTAAIGPLVFGIGKAVEVGGKLTSGFGKYVSLIGTVITKLGLFKGATAASTAAEETATVAKGISTTATAAEGTAAAVATPPVLALNAAMLPIIGIAVGVAAAIAGITIASIALAKHMGESSIPTVQLFGKETDDATRKAVGGYEKLNSSATEQLMELEVNTGPITQKIAQNLIETFDQMGRQIEGGFDKHFNTDYQIMASFYANSSALSDSEERASLAKMQASNSQQKQKIQEYENQIAGIVGNASSQHRALTEQEREQIAEIQQKMESDAITALSTTEEQASAIRERIRSTASFKSAQEAADVVKNAASARDATIKAANDQASKVENAATYERDVTHSITADQAAKVISSAENQKNQTVSKANQMFDQTVAAAKEKAPQFVDRINWQTGKVKSNWDYLNSKAATWGIDFMVSLTRGIISGEIGLFSEVAKVAVYIQKHLGHSVPTEGPLQDDNLWFQHLMQNLEGGIEAGTPSLMNKVNKTADAIRNAFSLPDFSDISGRIQTALNSSAALTVNAQLAGGGGTTDNSQHPVFNFTINAYGADATKKQDLQQLTKAVMQEAYRQYAQKKG